MRGALALLLLFGCGNPPPKKAPAKSAASAAKVEKAPDPKPVEAPPAPPSKARESTPSPSAEVLIPAADRVFVAPLDGRLDHLLTAKENQLRAVRPTRTGRGRILWTIVGPGAAQKISFGDVGRGPKLYVAWGVGRGQLKAPLVVQEIEPLTGEARELWSHQGPRNEVAWFEVTDVDGDGQNELGLAYYASKYFVRARHIEADGAPIEGPEVRMASSRAYADLDGDGGIDEIIGRVYGDDRGLPGNLRVDFGEGAVMVPTDKGVKAVAVARLDDDPRPTLYFADGWVADYGRNAKAQLKRVRWKGRTPVVETLVGSPDEFTFFDIDALDVDNDGAAELALRGDKRVSVLDRVDGAWKLRRLASLQPVLNTALGRSAEGGWTLYVPATPASRAIPVE